MISFETSIEKFGKKGEKTGWTYIEIPSNLAEEMNTGVKTSYRVKGQLDKLKIKQVAIIPMGDGCFILPINGEMRKQLKKQKGDSLVIKIELDKSEIKLNEDFLACLADDKKASTYFKSLAKSHQNYYSKFIESAKTDATKAKRIAQVIHAMSLGMSYPEMLRAQKAANQ